MVNLESYVLWVLAAAAGLGAIAWMWLLVRAFRQDLAWGLGLFLLPPLALVFVPTHWKPSRGPAALFLFASLLAATGLVLGQVPPSRDPHVTLVAGEKHVTLTRARVDDYSFIEKHPDTVVLQLANEDVTDETLKYLPGLSGLRELDLNDTQVSDAGLPTLAKLRSLKILKLNRTAVSDEGFRRHLADLPALVEVQMRGTTVATKTLRAWKKAGEKLKLERKFTSGK